MIPVIGRCSGGIDICAVEVRSSCPCVQYTGPYGLIGERCHSLGHHAGACGSHGVGGMVGPDGSVLSVTNDRIVAWLGKFGWMGKSDPTLPVNGVAISKFKTMGAPEAPGSGVSIATHHPPDEDWIVGLGI